MRANILKTTTTTTTTTHIYLHVHLEPDRRPVVFSRQGFPQRSDSISILTAVLSPRSRARRILHRRSLVSGEPKLHVVDEAESRRRICCSHVIVVFLDDSSGETVAIRCLDDVDQLSFGGWNVVDLRLFQHANGLGWVERPRWSVRLRLT